MNHTFLLFFLLFLLFLLLILLLCQQIACRRSTQAELQRLGKSLQEIREADSDQPVLIFTDNPEIQELAAQINQMLEAHRSVKADYRRARLSSKKMLSNISHDLKTPLTVISGYLELLRIQEPENEMLQKTEQKTQEVITLTNQFFTLAKLESEDMPLTIAPVDICELCRTHLLDYYEILTAGHVTVEVQLPEEPIFVQGNPEALSRILSNLISNAIRYGSDGGYLGIFLRTEEQQVFLSVTDHGRGIEKAYQDRVFDRLFTLEDSRSRRVQGNGLGLTIAKNLALRLGGTITLTSIPHKETTFTVCLRRAHRGLPSGERNL